MKTVAQKLAKIKLTNCLNSDIEEEMEKLGYEKYGIETALIRSRLQYGDYFEEGYPLFPMCHPFTHPERVMKEFAGGRGNFKIMIGVKERSHTENYTQIAWKKMYSMPREYFILFEYEFSESQLIISQESEKILQELKFNFPEKGKLDDKFYVLIKNIYTANIETQVKVMPAYFNNYSSDFGGYGVQIENPFDFEKVDLVELGWLAKDIQAFQFEKVENACIEHISALEYFSRLYLEKYFLKYNLKNKIIKYGEGNYQGKSGCNSWNTGMRNVKQIKLDKPSDLMTFGFLGCRILDIG